MVPLVDMFSRGVVHWKIVLALTAAFVFTPCSHAAASDSDLDAWTTPVAVHWEEDEGQDTQPGVTVEHSRWVWRGSYNALTPALRTELIVKLPAGWSYVGAKGDGARVVKTDAKGSRLLIEQTEIAATVALEYRAADRKIPLTLELIAQWREPAIIALKTCPSYQLQLLSTRPQGRHLFLGYTCNEDEEGAEFYFVRSTEATWKTPLASSPQALSFRTRVARPPRSEGLTDNLLVLETHDQDGDAAKFAVSFTGGRPKSNEWLEVQPRLFLTSESVTDRTRGGTQFGASPPSFGLNLLFGRTWDSRWKMFAETEIERVSYPSPFSGRPLSQPSTVMSKTGLGVGRDFNDRFSTSLDLAFAQEMFMLPQANNTVSSDETGLARARVKASYDWIIRNNLASGLELSGGYYFPKEMLSYTVNSCWMYGAKLSYRATGAPRASRLWFDGDFFFNQIVKNTTVAHQLTTEVGIELRFSFAFWRN